MLQPLPKDRITAWNSIYASFRGHSALSGTVIGADPLSMNVRSKVTGQVERRTMYCVVVLVYRVPVYIPATEMWMDEARPDYVLQNMMGSTIDFIITKVDREGGYAIASRRQASRAQRFFFAHRPDLCAEGSRVKCRLASKLANDFSCVSGVEKLWLPCPATETYYSWLFSRIKKAILFH